MIAKDVAKAINESFFDGDWHPFSHLCTDGVIQGTVENYLNSAARVGAVEKRGRGEKAEFRVLRTVEVRDLTGYKIYREPEADSGQAPAGGDITALDVGRGILALIARQDDRIEGLEARVEELSRDNDSLRQAMGRKSPCISAKRVFGGAGKAGRRAS